MPTRNINLTDHFDNFVAAEIETGNYRNASEVLRAGLRLLEQRKQEDEQKIAVLKALAEEGFAQVAQGRAIRLETDRDLVEYMAELGRRSEATAKKRTRPA
jgi:antitoxin ParD1/3/4